MELGSPLPARPSLAPLPHAQALTSFMVSMEAKYLDHQSSMLSSGSSSSGSSELPFFFFFFLSFSSSAWRVGQVQSPAYVPVPWPLLEPWAISETPIPPDRLFLGTPGLQKVLWSHQSQRGELCFVEVGATAQRGS